MSKKTTTPTKGKPSAKKPPSMSKSAARAEGAAKSERLRKTAIAEIGERLADGAQDHEVATAKEIANTTHPVTEAPPTKVKGAKGTKAAKADEVKDAKAKVEPKPKPEPKLTREPKPKKPSGLDLAAKVLIASQEPLSAKAIVERVLEAGWRTGGKTPHATIYAAILRDMASKGDASRFRKSDRGLFAAATGKGA